ncbi:MAG: carbohydrate ABC transporter permease [Phycisphaeraceae bacterium]
MTDKRPLWMTALLYLGALALAVIAFGPAVWLIATAFAGPGVPISRLPAPGELTTDNFAGAWNDGGLGGAATDTGGTKWWTSPLVNSILVTVAQAFLNVILAALAAYPLARMDFRGRGLIFLLILTTIMVPEQVIVVPMFQTVVGLGLYDTLAAVVLPFSVTAFGVYLCRQAFLAIPSELEEAARVDGASALHIWWHVMLPLAKPALATLAVFSVIGAWSNLLWPLIVLQSKETHTLPVAINQLLGVFATNVRYAYAASVLAILPVILFYILAQKQLTRGLLAGAVKG